ncbi:hypothetical protein JCM35486_05660 [Blautia wexlerae]
MSKYLLPYISWDNNHLLPKMSDIRQLWARITSDITSFINRSQAAVNDIQHLF